MAIGDVKARIERSDGKEMTIGDGDWRIPNDGLNNWANLPYTVSNVEIPSADGAQVTSKRVSAVDRTIKAVAARIEDNEGLRAAAIAFFNPKYTYRVYMTYQGRTRWCEGEQYGFKASEGNMYEPAEITWTILCPNPYLQSVDDFGKDIAEVVPRFGFPFYSALSESTAKVNKGFIASNRTYEQNVSIRNDGDVPSAMRATIKANDGEVVNPSLTIGNGTVRVITTMKNGDELYLDAEQRPPVLELNGENAMQKLDRESTILSMMIEPGDTEVSYTADSGEQYMDVVIRYNKQYLGI